MPTYQAAKTAGYSEHNADAKYAQLLSSVMQMTRIMSRSPKSTDSVQLQYVGRLKD